MKIYKISILFFFFITHIVLYAQDKWALNLPQVTHRSQDANDLIKAIMFPVDYITGSTKIEIPIFDITLKDGTTLPIKIAYTSTGYKPGEYKPRVGLGWVLKAEPQIARNVNGLPDEFCLLNASPEELKELTLKPYDRYKQLFEIKNPVFSHYFDTNGDSYYYSLLNGSGKFVPSLILSPKAEIKFHTIPYDPIGVEYIKDKRNNDYNQINITDKVGVKYSFTSKDMQTRETGIFDKRGVLSYPTIFKVDKLETPLNETMTFEYEKRLDPFFVLNNEDQITVSTLVRAKVSAAVETPSTPYYTPGFDSFYSNILEDYIINYKETVGYTDLHNVGFRDGRMKIFNYSNNNGYTKTCFQTYLGQNLHNVYTSVPVDNSVLYQQQTNKEIKKINFPGGDVTFNNKYLEKAYSVLDNIVVRNDREVIKYIKFYYSAGDSDNGSQVFLDSIAFLNPHNENDRLSYSFNYNNFSSGNRHYFSAHSPNPKNTDIWGFESDHSVNSSCWVPSMYLGFKYYLDFQRYEDSTRIYIPGENPCINYDDGVYLGKPTSDRFMLSKLTYPTKGYSKFYYEPHRYLQDSEKEPYTNYTGGLRINKIEYYDSPEHLSTTNEYKYGENENGYGVPYHVFKQSDFLKTELIDWDVSPIYISMREHRIYIRNKPYYNTTYALGSSMLYSQVSEYKTSYKNGKTESTGKTIYKYKIDRETDDIPRRDYDESKEGLIHAGEYSDFEVEWKYGQLLTKEIYETVSNQNYKLKSKTDYIYDDKYLDIYSEDRVITNLAIRFTTPPAILPSLPSDYAKFMNDELIGDGNPKHVGIALLSSQKDWVDGVETRTFYNYAYNLKDQCYKHINPISKQVVNEYTENYYYPTDLLSSNANPDQQNVYSLMTKRNILDKQIKVETIKNNSKSSSLIDFRFWDKTNPLSVTAEPPTSALFSEKELFIGKNNQLESRLSFHRRDSYGNPLHASKDGIEVFYIWSYLGRYPIAKIENSTYSQVETAVQETFGKSISELSLLERPGEGDLRRLYKHPLLNGALISIYTYKPLVGMTSATDPSGKTTYYDYDVFGRLKETYLDDGRGNRITLQLYQYHYQTK